MGGVVGSDDQNNIVINQDFMKIVVGRQIKTHEGWMCEADMLPSDLQLVEYVTSNVDSVMMREVGIIQINEKSKHARKTTELVQYKVQGFFDKEGRNKRYQWVSQSIRPSIRGNHSCNSSCRRYLIKGKFNSCQDFSLGKARQDNVSKTADHKSTNKGEQVLLISVHLQPEVWVVNRIGCWLWMIAKTIAGVIS